MARQLWLLRHGEAEPHGAAPDFDRRLTAKGEQQSRDAGRALAALGTEFASVYTSPRVRALDTARLACVALGIEPAVHEPLSAGFSAREALELMAGEPDGSRVLIVGHEPDFSQIAHDLTGARLVMKKGGIAVVKAEGAAAHLLALLRPAELSLIAATEAAAGARGADGP